MDVDQDDEDLIDDDEEEALPPHSDPRISQRCHVAYDAIWYEALVCDYDAKRDAFTVYYFQDGKTEANVPKERIRFH
jgi:hypothetical protein